MPYSFQIFHRYSYLKIAMYHKAGKFGKFGELSMIRQTKTIQISTYN